MPHSSYRSHNGINGRYKLVNLTNPMHKNLENWNIYGQLGHGGTENVAEPKVVPFFKFRKILQVSLGHAHSLVLCQSSNEAKNTELFVFGSNHFGQLGLGSRKLGQTNEPSRTSCISKYGGRKMAPTTGVVAVVDGDDDDGFEHNLTADCYHNIPHYHAWYRVVEF
uniref:Uncharacterized protein n=1 Tax=Glossina austeni TaxID=7395 RepID=A0A1A9VGG0_GLOAU